jgi:hypothetical protein
MLDNGVTIHYLPGEDLPPPDPDTIVTKYTRSYLLPVELLTTSPGCSYCPALYSSDTGAACRALGIQLPKYQEGNVLTYRRADSCPLQEVP